MMKSLWIAVLILLPGFALAQRDVAMGGEDTISSESLQFFFRIPLRLHCTAGFHGSDQWDTNMVWQSGGDAGYIVEHYGLQYSVHPYVPAISVGGDSLTFTLDTIHKLLKDLTLIEFAYLNGSVNERTVRGLSYHFDTNHHFSSFSNQGDTSEGYGASYACTCPNCWTGQQKGRNPDTLWYFRLDAGPPAVQSVQSNSVLFQPAMMVDYSFGGGVVNSEFSASDMKRDLTIHDALGRFISSRSILPNETEAEFNVSAWPSGVYFLTLSGACGKFLIP